MTNTTEITRRYRAFRKAGMNPAQALSSARTVERFESLADQGLVRLRLEPEEESYISVYGKPDGYVDSFGRRVSADQALAQLIDTIESSGCHRSVSEYWSNDAWHHADSCGMHVGYQNPLDPLENWYIVDHMASACNQAENALDDMCMAI